jgi:hypothetical protein
MDAVLPTPHVEFLGLARPVSTVDFAQTRSVKRRLEALVIQCQRDPYTGISNAFPQAPEIELLRQTLLPHREASLKIAKPLLDF